jgi:hypothetical protein
MSRLSITTARAANEDDEEARPLDGPDSSSDMLALCPLSYCLGEQEFHASGERVDL